MRSIKGEAYVIIDVQAEGSPRIQTGMWFSAAISTSYFQTDVPCASRPSD